MTRTLSRGRLALRPSQHTSRRHRRTTQLRFDSLEDRVVPAGLSTSAHPVYAVGTDAGVVGRATVFDADTHQPLWSVAPYGSRYKGAYGSRWGT